MMNLLVRPVVVLVAWMVFILAGATCGVPLAEFWKARKGERE